MADGTGELHERLLHCARRARAVDVRPFELRPATDAILGLVPPVIEALEASIRACRDVLAAYDPAEAESGGELDLGLDVDFGGTNPRDTGVFHVQVDELVGRPAEERRIADVAFLGVSELRPKLARVERLRVEHDPWEIVAECGSALRRIEKSLTAIEVALAHALGVPTQLSFASQLTRSLQVREQYARLRAAVSGQVVTTEAGQHKALRLVGTAIAMLIGKDIYPDLRIHDRRQLRALQERILAWLRDDAGSPERRFHDGQRLWQDIVGFSDLLVLVSRRQELVEHDALLVAEMHERLSRRAADFGPRHVERLRALRGLDQEIDRLLDGGETSAAAWGPPIRRLNRSLCEPTGVHAVAEGEPEGRPT